DVCSSDLPATGVLLGGASVKLRAQRGPGLASRQRTSARPTGGGSAALNEGRDSRPGNGRADRAGSSTATAALNEGRDSRPGNGGAQYQPSSRWRIAQRGPGLASRQRERHVVREREVVGERSTRAGTRVPATARPRSRPPLGPRTLN